MKKNKKNKNKKNKNKKNKKIDKNNMSPLWRGDIIISFSDFFSLCSALTDIHLIFATLFCHTELEIKFKFGFYPFEFHEVMAHGLRKTLQIVSFCTLVVPQLALQSQIVRNQNLVFFLLELFWLKIPPVGDLVLLAILSECLFV
jgi:hypothetical protein